MSDQTRIQSVSTTYYKQLDEHPLDQLEAQVAEEWEVGDVILNLYEITALLGEGGMGKVYRVHHRGWNLDLAVKCPKAEVFASQHGKDDYIREAETWISLGLHPYIASCYYVRTLGGVPRLFAECVEGGSLESWIESRRLYEGGKEKALERILDIAIQFAWGLGYAHEQGLVHQDVKPHNVLMTPDGIARVTDFGLAKARVVAGQERQEQGSPFVSAGGYTPAYCSPEQAQGRKLDHKTDIWSWAVSILEMFTGGVMWMSGIAAAGVLESLVEFDMGEEGIPGLPDQLSSLLKDCLLDDPVSRPCDALEISAKLINIYRMVTGKPYHRMIPKAIELRADNLNNRALSLLDLGNPGAAATAWQEALVVDPSHLDSLYNRFLSHWQIERDHFGPNLIERIREGAEKTSDNFQLWLLMAKAHGDLCNTAGQEFALSKAQYIVPQEKEVQDAILKAHEQQINHPCIEQSFKEGGARIRSIFPNGQYVLDDHGIFNLSSGIYQGWHAYQRDFRPQVALRDGKHFLATVGPMLHLCRIVEGSSSQIIRSYEAHRAEIQSLAIHPDGRLVVTAGDDQVLVLWDLSTGGGKVLKGHTAPVTAVVFSPDGKVIISGGEDRVLRIWDMPHGACTGTIPCEMKRVTSLEVSRDGRYLVAAGEGSPLTVWDLRTLQQKLTFGSDIYNQVLVQEDIAIGLAANAKSPAFDERLNFISFFDLKTGLELAYLEFPLWKESTPYLETFGRLHSMVSLPGQRKFLIGADKVLYCVDAGVLNQSPDAQFRVTRVYSSEIYFRSENEYHQLIQDAQNAIRAGLWDKADVLIERARALPEYRHHPDLLDLWALRGLRGTKSKLSAAWLRKTIDKDQTCCIAMAPGGKWYATGERDGQIHLWEFYSGQRIATLTQGSGTLRKIRIANSGNSILSESQNGYSMWIQKDGHWFAQVQDFGKEYGFLRSISNDGNLVLSSDDRKVTVWHTASGSIAHQFSNTQREECALSADGQWLIKRSTHFVEVNELGTEAQIAWFSYDDEDISSVSVTPDRKRLLVGTDVGSIYVKDIDTEDVVELLEEGEATELVPSADGRFVLASGWFKGVSLWDLQEGKRIHQFDGPDNVSATITPEGRYVLIDCDSQFQIWELEWDYEFPL